MLASGLMERMPSIVQEPLQIIAALPVATMPSAVFQSVVIGSSEKKSRSAYRSENAAANASSPVNLVVPASRSVNHARFSAKPP